MGAGSGVAGCGMEGMWFCRQFFVVNLGLLTESGVAAQGFKQRFENGRC